MDKIELTWDEFDFDCNKMIEAIRQAESYDLIIGIGRGGLIPAVMCSHKLSVLLCPVTWQTRDGKNQGKLVLNNIVDNSEPWSRILVVDDINDSGKTMDEITNHMRNRLADLDKPVIINIATVYQKDNTILSSDFIGKMLDERWVVFPWED